MATLPTSSDTSSPEGKNNETAFTLINNSIQEILDAFQQPTVLLDPNEKVISVNSNFLKLFSHPNADDLIGKKPIEIFNCTFAIDTKWDSQNAEHCHNCGTNLHLKGIKVTRQRFTERCNLTFVDETRQTDELQNMKVTISPFALDGEQLYLFSITDISNDVRRRLLEKIFFHDVLNKAGNIIGILDVLNLIGHDDERSDDLYNSLKKTSKDLISEIKYQSDLASAGNNELKPVFSTTSSLEILYSTKNEMVNSEVANHRKILISSIAIDHQIITDGVLLRRVLINMLKNALEATRSGGKVIMGCEMLNQENFRFWVHNDTSITPETQILLFNISTSTRGAERGLGTLSMKLIGEKYLHGKVHFISSEDTGTNFMIDVPLNHKQTL